MWHVKQDVWHTGLVWQLASLWKCHLTFNFLCSLWSSQSFHKRMRRTEKRRPPTVSKKMKMIQYIYTDKIHKHHFWMTFSTPFSDLKFGFISCLNCLWFNHLHLWTWNFTSTTIRFSFSLSSHVLVSFFHAMHDGPYVLTSNALWDTWGIHGGFACYIQTHLRMVSSH